MLLSPAERSYLFDSLTQSPPIRPDARLINQFRPLEANTSFLPSSNGSARLRLVDGSECLVSVKSKVVLTANETSLIEFDVDVSGHRDDSNYVSNLKFNLIDLINKRFPHELLKLTSKYSTKLFVDCVVISHSSYPLSLLSFTCYLALKTTKLPLLISEINDEDIVEEPTFSDDWNNARLLSEMSPKCSNFQPPIYIVLGIIGKNIIFDPSLEEEQVLENGLIIGWYNKKVIMPITNINASSNSNLKGVKQNSILDGISLVNKNANSIIEALDNIILQDSDDGVVFQSYS